MKIIPFNNHYSSVKLLQKFKNAPENVKNEIEIFLRNIRNGKDWKSAMISAKGEIVLEALIGLKYFGTLSEEEEKIFIDFLAKRAIQQHSSNKTFYVPLPI